MKKLRTLLISLISFGACLLSSCGNFFAPEFLNSSSEETPSSNTSSSSSGENNQIFIVSFSKTYETIIQDQFVRYGEKVIRPVDPVRTNYTFLGWKLLDETDWDFDNDVVTKDMTLYAAWTREKFHIDASVNDPSMGYVTGGGTYNSGATATLEAIPYSGYQFVEWRDSAGAFVSSESILTLNVTANASYVAYFEQEAMYTVEFEDYDTSMGYVTGDGEYPYGAEVTIEATAYQGCRFSYWKDSDGNFITEDYKYTFTITTHMCFIPIFEEHLVYLNVRSNNDAYGRVTGGGTFRAGTSTTVEAIPNSGYLFNGWYNYNTSEFVYGNKKYTFEIYEDLVLEARFAQDTTAYDVVAVPNDNNMGYVTGAGSYPAGTEVTLKAIPYEGYAFVRWETSDGVSLTTNNTYTITVTKNISMVAVFRALNTYTVTLSVNNINAGTVTGGGTYYENTQVTIEALPGAKYSFVYWAEGDDGFAFSYSAQFTITVTRDISLTAIFQDDTVYYSVELSSFTSAAGTVTGAGRYSEGSTVTIEATPYDGYFFDGWYYSDGSLFSYDNPCSFTANRNITLLANWSLASSKVNVHYDSEVCNVTINATSSVIMLYCEVESGYKFSGFYWDENRTNLITSEPRCSLTPSREPVDIYVSCDVLSDEELVSYYNFELNEDGQSYSVTGFSGNGLKNAIIPSVYNGLPVTIVGPGAFENKRTIEDVYLPDSIIGICHGAFADGSFTSIRLSNNLEFIERNAFGFSALRSINIPASVTQISDEAFIRSSLENVYVDPNNSDFSSIDGVLYDKAITTLIYYPTQKSNTTFNVPSGVTTIGNQAFYENRYLESINLPDTIRVIRNNGFGNLTNLRSIVLPDGVSEICDFAFIFCSKLQSINIPASVLTIGTMAFNGCESLSNIDVDPNNQFYSSIDGVLYNKDVTTIITYPIGKAGDSFTIPLTVTTIGQYAFAYSTLTSINIPYGVTTIDGYAFGQCRQLTNINIPSSVTFISSQVFEACVSLSSIVIPSSVTYLGGMCFNMCQNLTIYCEAASKPDDWEASWLDSWGNGVVQVIWGYHEG